MVGENARPSAKAGRIRCRQALDKNIEASDQQRIEQQKAGDMRLRQAWRHFAGERQRVQHHAEHEQQDQPPEKFRNRQQQDRSEVGERLEPACRADETAGGRRQYPKSPAITIALTASSIVAGSVAVDQRSGLAAERNGAAEIAVHRGVEPDQILLRQRPVEAHFAALGFDFRNRRGRRQRHRGRDRPEEAAARRTAAPKRSAGSGSPRAGGARSAWRRSRSFIVIPRRGREPAAPAPRGPRFAREPGIHTRRPR